MLAIHCDGVCCFVSVCVCVLCALLVEYCVMFSGACVCDMLLCLSLRSGLNVLVWYVCDVFV